MNDVTVINVSTWSINTALYVLDLTQVARVTLSLSWNQGSICKRGNNNNSSICLI